MHADWHSWAAGIVSFILLQQQDGAQHQCASAADKHGKLLSSILLHFQCQDSNPNLAAKRTFLKQACCLLPTLLPRLSINLQLPQTMGKVAEINLKYGSKAALAIGNAAFNDFAPLLIGLAPQMLPQLAAGLNAGPAGILPAIAGLASGIGGALMGNVGLEGPDLLANRVSGLLPGNLLSQLPDMDVDVPPAVMGGGSFGGISGGEFDGFTNNGGDLLSGIVANMPPEVLDLITTFLAGE
jgi:hypothetical protein